LNPDTTEPILAISGLTVTFPENGITACSGITFSVREGEILAVMGENGAGKSTLMNLLSGFIRPDSGTIRLGNSAEVGMIHQKPILAGSMTVWENILMGHRNGRFFLNPRRIAEKIRAVQDRYGLPLNIQLKCRELTAPQIQRAEIIESLLLDRKILIFDEPTACLSEDQIDELMTLIRRLQKEGRTILFITHKIQEAFRLADRIAVLRKGTLRLLRETAVTTPAAVSTAMIGEGPEPAPAGDTPAPSRRTDTGPVLELSGVTCLNQGTERLKDIGLSLYPGEILGIAGIRENGLAVLEDLLTGLLHPHKGKMFLNGKDITPLTPYRLRKLGISYIPADRLTRGASLESTLAENLILLKRKLTGSSRSYRTGQRNWAEHLIRRSGIDGLPDQQVKTLSGGNIQKLIVARELSEKPSLLIISEPSWGLDFSSRERLHRQIMKTRSGGAAVLLLTTDIDELLVLSDRIAVLTGGELTESPAPAARWTRKTIGDRMTGADRL